jgi:hypothetical protein
LSFGISGCENKTPNDFPKIAKVCSSGNKIFASSNK